MAQSVVHCEQKFSFSMIWLPSCSWTTCYVRDWASAPFSTAAAS